MEIRKTRISDIPEVMRIYRKAKEFMIKSGNSDQWVDGYPSDRQLNSDIDAGASHVISDDNGKIVATFYFIVGNEPTYAVINDGEWIDNAPYGVVHRLASDGTVRGVLRTVLDFCFRQTHNIRIDTHSDNNVMRKGLLDYGFQYCGIINISNGDERMAYQLHK